MISLFFSSEKRDEGYEISAAEKEEIEIFIHSLKERRYSDSIKYNRHKFVENEIVLTEFDPNSADSLLLMKLGIPKYVVRNIIKYRKAGGRFKDAESLSKIYGLDSSLFEKLKPYIVVSPEYIVKTDTFSGYKKDSAKQYKYQHLTKVDLNSADTSVLKKIPGIGSGLAKMIVSYRNKLGGYISVDQLDEIGYIDKRLYEWFDVINPIDEKNKIMVNSSSLEKLRNHPYMNFYKAKVIIEYRRRRGKIKNLSQLALFEEFTEKDLEKLSKYLYFD